MARRKHVAGERVDLLDDYDLPARTITETGLYQFKPPTKLDVKKKELDRVRDHEEYYVITVNYVISDYL